MTKAQFALLTAALGLATMGGAGYIAYAGSAPQGSGGGNGASADGTATAPIVPPGGAASTQPDPGPGTGLPGGGAGAQACQDGEVQVAERQGQGAAGHVSLLLVFQNTGGSACVLRGYPGASLSGADGTDLLDATRTMSGYLGGAIGSSKPPAVLLAPGSRASAVLEWSDVDTGAGCAVQNPAHLLVTPPNTKQTTTLPIDPGAQVCSGFQIHPVVKGVLTEPVAAG